MERRRSRACTACDAGVMTTSAAPPFRVLTLEGGGIRGTFTASFLAAIERTTGKRVCDYFDLIVGTSTGGLIALGLGTGKTAQAILDFYVSRGPGIFGVSRGTRAWRSARHWVMAKHPAAGLRAAVLDFFGADPVLRSSTKRLVVPAFNATTGKPTCFKTPHHARLRVDGNRKIWEVAMATSAAPTFFEPFRSSWGTTYVDGGIWANRPSMVGIVEAHDYLGAPLDRIHLLSIRTPGSQFRLRRLPLAGIVPWAWRLKLINMIFEANGSAATFQGQILGGDRFVEVGADTGIHPIDLDDPRDIDLLRGLGEEAAKVNVEMVASTFLKIPVDPLGPWSTERPASDG